MKGQALQVFDTIAHHLAAYGIASLRYDKRGCGDSEGNFLVTGHSDLVDDAVNCFDTLLVADFVDREKVFLLGHSEGCIIAPQVATQRSNVAGQILLCPFIDTMESILCKQSDQIGREFETAPGALGMALRLYCRIMGSPITIQRKLIAKLKSTDSDTFRIAFRKVPAKWLRQLLDLDPPAIFRQVECPTLLLGGEKDLQCDPADVPRIAECLKGPVVTRVIENLTHILRLENGPPSMLGVRRLLQEPVDQAVLVEISSWLEKCQHSSLPDE